MGGWIVASRLSRWIACPLIANWGLGCGGDSTPGAVPATGRVPAPPARSGASAGVVSPPRTVAVPPLELKVSPASITLSPGDSSLQLIARGVGPRGGEVDLTSKSTGGRNRRGGSSSMDAGRIATAGAGSGDGPGETRERRGDEPGDGRLRVGKKLGFRADVVPIFPRSGCNTGGCHGRAGGQNGFHLSLFGYDPTGDFQSVSRDSGARRLSRLDPAESLLLRKATGRVPHGGGPRRTPPPRSIGPWWPGSRPGRPRAGDDARRTRGDRRRAGRRPAGRARPAAGAGRARYTDGHRRDVTRLASFRPLDESAASVDPSGRAVLLRRAETDLIVRYQSQVLSVRLASP